MVDSSPIQAKAKIPRSRLFLAILLPWLWVSIGLFIIRNYQITFLLYEVMGCLAPALILGSFGKLNTLFHRKSIDWGKVIFLVLLGNVLLLTAGTVANGTFMDPEQVRRFCDNLGLMPGETFALVCLAFLLINPPLEELFWRGTVYQAMKEDLGKLPAIILSSFAFGAWHWLIINMAFPPDAAIFFTFVVIIGGIIFASLYEETGSLIPSILVHGLGADLPILFILLQVLGIANF